MKKIIIYSFMAIFNFVVNFLIYNYSFNAQATPFLHESQRVESGLMMFNTTVPAYAFTAIVITIIFYVLSGRLGDNKHKNA